MVILKKSVELEMSRKFLKAEWPKFNDLGNFHPQILKESTQQSQILH